MQKAELRGVSSEPNNDDVGFLDRAANLPGADYGRRIYSQTALLALAMQREYYEDELQRTRRTRGRRELGSMALAAVLIVAAMATPSSSDRRANAGHLREAGTVVRSLSPVRPAAVYDKPVVPEVRGATIRWSSGLASAPASGASRPDADQFVSPTEYKPSPVAWAARPRQPWHRPDQPDRPTKLARVPPVTISPAFIQTTELAEIAAGETVMPEPATEPGDGSSIQRERRRLAAIDALRALRLR